MLVLSGISWAKTLEIKETTPNQIITRNGFTFYDLIGFVRMMYPFFCRIVNFRMENLFHLKNAFFCCSLLVILILARPKICGGEHLHMNGVNYSAVVILFFTLIIFLAPSGEIKSKFSSRVCKFFGYISYPISITHYVILYIPWVADNKTSFSKAFQMSLLVLLSCVALAYICLKL